MEAPQDLATNREGGGGGWKGAGVKNLSFIVLLLIHSNLILVD